MSREQASGTIIAPNAMSGFPPAPCLSYPGGMGRAAVYVKTLELQSSYFYKLLFGLDASPPRLRRELTITKLHLNANSLTAVPETRPVRVKQACDRPPPLRRRKAASRSMLQPWNMPVFRCTNSECEDHFMFWKSTGKPN
uniref:Uncharacterized protein n=1 Tax=Coccidioides posadasii RMSCC 3488 TaxID=454284 RepID=A0A0J6FLG6_COCPO|nr:hypothetical protein CPAG_07485 [Coccidioides posadasii RMSCC 3488]